MARLCLLIAGIVFGPPATHAESQLIEELFRSEVVYPQQRGELQLSLTPELHRTDSLRTATTIEYGITDTWQVGFRWGRPIRHQSDPAEVEFSIKRSFMNVRESETHFALGFEAGRASRPESSEGGEPVELEPFVVLARDLADRRAQVFFASAVNLSNLRASRKLLSDDDDDRRTDWAAGGFAKLGPAVLTGELNWRSPGWNQFASGNQVYGTTGLIRRPGRESAWEFGVGSSLGLSSEADPVSVILKVTYEFERIPWRR